MYGDSFLQEISAVERIREKTNCYRFSTLVFPCSNNSVLLASRCRSIFITIKTILKAFILETGMIIAVPDPDSKEFPYGSNVTYIAKFFKKEEKSRSLTSTGSGFEKNCTDPNTGYFMLAVSKINRCFNAKFIVLTLIGKKITCLKTICLRTLKYLGLWVEDRRGLG